MASEFLQVRRRPTRAKHPDFQRDSHLVRASVLETALELGFAQNSTVADWIFNNPLSEEVEEHHPQLDTQCTLDTLDTKSDPVPDIAEVCIPSFFFHHSPHTLPLMRNACSQETTPTFTSRSNSISDESSSLNSPENNASSAAVTAIQVHMHKPSLTESPHVSFGDFSSDQLQLFSPFALSPHDAHRTESKGSSVAKLPKDNERSRSQDDSLSRHPSQGCADAGYASEGQYLSTGKASKGKGEPGKSKGNKGSRSKVLDNSKTTEKDLDYASDGGYLSASSNKSQGKSPSRVKSRAMAFFRRRPKKAASDDEDEDIVPPVPALPILPSPSSPKLLERRVTPSSLPPSGFSPLTLNLTSPPASPSRRRLSKSPPPTHRRAAPPRRLDHVSVIQRPASPLVVSSSAPTILTPPATAATVPLPPSAPSTPLSTTSFSTSSTPSTQLGGGTGSTQKSLAAPSSRQHLSIRPPAPPPTLPLPQPPPSPSTSSNGMFPPLLPAPAAPSRRGAPTRPVPMMPASPGSSQPLTPGRTASPLRPLLSPRTLPPTVSHTRNSEFAGGFDGDQLKGKEFTGRQRSVTAYSGGLGGTPAFLQRKIQHAPPSPRHPPPDAPLPPSPCLAPSPRPRTPIGSSSKFHEHFSSVSVPLSHILSTPASMSPSPSTATLSESSSGPSIRSSHVSSVSGRSEEPAIRDIRDSSNVLEYSRPETSASIVSESSYGQPITSRLSRPLTDFRSQFSGRSDISSSIYSPRTHRDSSSVTTYDDADADDGVPKSCVDEEDDDASVYTSDDKTAGRRTMYLVEHGELDENSDEIVIGGSRYWGDHQAPPPLPPLPPFATRPGPGYF